MNRHWISTQLGRIAVHEGSESGSDPEETPLVFMHGVFLDSSLWFDLPLTFSRRRLIFIDMPGHGQSQDVGRGWSLDDCVAAMPTILDALRIKQCIAIGHSWGSMTALRAAVRYPTRFSALALFNMPVRRTSGIARWNFQIQKLLVGFRGFYARQAAKSLYSSEFLAARPEMSQRMVQRLSSRPARELSRALSAVLLGADDAEPYLQSLSIPALAVVGETDYVGIPPHIPSRTIPGGHISPHEAPIQTVQVINDVLSWEGEQRGSARANSEVAPRLPFPGLQP